MFLYIFNLCFPCGISYILYLNPLCHPEVIGVEPFSFLKLNGFPLSIETVTFSVLPINRKKLFSSLSIEAVGQIEMEIINRFGLVSDGLFCLFNTQKIRILCALLGINNIILRSGSVLSVSFSNKIKKVDHLLSTSKDYFCSLNVCFSFSSFKLNKLVLKIVVDRDVNIFSFLNNYLNTLLK